MQNDRRPSRGWIWIGKSLGMAVLGGCGLFGSPIPEGGKPVRQVYEEMDEPPAPLALAVAPVPAPGASPRSLPVIYPPRIFAVHVEEHVDPRRDLLIGAHWIYVKLRESSWVEEPLDRELPTSLPLGGPDDLQFVRSALGKKGLAGALIPVKPAAGPTPPEKDDSPRPRREDGDAARSPERRR